MKSTMQNPCHEIAKLRVVMKGTLLIISKHSRHFPFPIPNFQNRFKNPTRDKTKKAEAIISQQNPESLKSYQTQSENRFSNCLFKFPSCFCVKRFSQVIYQVAWGQSYSCRLTSLGTERNDFWNQAFLNKSYKNLTGDFCCQEKDFKHPPMAPPRQ